MNFMESVSRFGYGKEWGLVIFLQCRMVWRWMAQNDVRERSGRL